MISEKLRNAMLKKQGDLLYTTIAEECSELIQTVSKAKRDLYNNGFIEAEHMENIIEEIGDVELNIELFKYQLAKDFFENANLDSKVEFIDDLIKQSKDKKNKKMESIFLNGEM